MGSSRAGSIALAACDGMKSFLYEEIARLEERHWWFVGRRRIVFDLIDSHVSPPVRILDAGCGAGFTTAALAVFGEVAAFDMAPEAIDCAARKAPVVKLGTITAIPYADGCFDMVTALDVLEHEEDEATALGELSRVLKPGGILVITVPACRFLWSPHDEVNGHKRRYSAGELRAKLRQGGFEILKLSYYNALLFVPIALARFFRCRFPARQEPKLSDFSVLHRKPVNAILSAIFSLERHLLRYVDLPFGVSLVCVAERVEGFGKAESIE